MFFIVLIGEGCSRHPDPVHVSGTVTFRGKPVPKGIVFIHPNQQKGNSGPYGVAMIKNGRFDTSQQGGSGAMPGFVKIAVGGYDESGKSEDFSDATPLFNPYQIEAEIHPEPSHIEITVPG